MNKKNFFDYLTIIAAVAWIPLGISAFYVSSIALDTKLFISACVSIVFLLVCWVKLE